MPYVLLEDEPKPKAGRYVLLDDEPAQSVGRAKPSNAAVLLNSINKGLAGVPDSVLNAPTHLANLVAASASVAAHKLGLVKQPWDLPFQTPDLAHKGLKSIGAIRDGAEPLTSGQRVLDLTGQAIGGGMVNPAGSVRQMTANMALGGASGLAGGVVQEATGSPLAGVLASMGAVPAMAMGADLVKRNAQSLVRPAESRVGRTLTRAADMTSDELAAQIRAGNVTLVPGAEPTTVQAAQNAGLSQLKRSAQSAGADFVTREQAQNAARVAALEKLAPGAAGKTAKDTAENFGRVAAEEAGVWRDVVKQARRDAYQSPALASAALPTPGAKALQGVLDSFYPSGALPGDSNASTLFAFKQRLEQPGQIPFKEFDAFRKLAGNKARDLVDTDRTAAAAWGALKSQLDNVEQTAIANAQHKLQPTGQGPWGPVYGNLAGDPENAIAHLLRTKTGEVPGAGIHPLAGSIDLIAGDSKMGLRHIEAKGRDDVLRGLPGLLSEGSWYSRPSSGPGRTYLGDPKNEAVVRMEWDGGAKQWMPTAYERGPKNSYPLETGRTTNWADSNSGQLSPGNQAGMRSSIDDAWGQVLSDAAGARQPAVPAVPPRDPRQYNGLLAPDQAGALRQGRDAHMDLMNRFESGPAMYLWRTGPDGLPQAQGAEVAQRFLNSGNSQVADAQALKRMVLERGPTLQAAREHVMADLLQSGTNPAGDLLEGKLRNHVNARSGMLREVMTPQQMETISLVRDDLRRANAAEDLNKVRGSDTAQKLLGAGVLESPTLMRAAGLLSKFGTFGLAGELGPALLEKSAAAVRLKNARAVSDALQDPEVALRALGGLLDARTPPASLEELLRPLPGVGLGLLGNMPMQP